MRNLNILQLKQMVKSINWIVSVFLIVIFILPNSAFSQTADEQQWWFNVEFIAFKRTLLPSNNENFAKADFLMAQVKPVDLFSLTLLKQKHALQFYIDQLPLCGTHIVEPESDDDINNIDDEVNDETPDVDDELNQTIAKSAEQTVDITENEITTVDSKLNVDNTNTAIENPELDKLVLALLPTLFSFEQQDTVQNKLLCINDMSGISDNEIENKNVTIQLNSPSFMFASIQSITEIPERIFADDASFNYTHSLLSQADITLEEYTQKVFGQRDIQALLYTAWRQEVVFGEENALFYRINAGKRLQIEEKFDYDEALSRYNQAHLAETDGPELQSNQVFFDELAEALNKKEPVDWLAEQPTQINKQIEHNAQYAQWELDGLFKVYLDYVNQVPYLHVNTEFKHYKIQIDENGRGQIDSYPLKQRRRIVSKQIHYFDHPAFGIIIRLERFTPPIVETLETVETLY